MTTRATVPSLLALLLCLGSLSGMIPTLAAAGDHPSTAQADDPSLVVASERHKASPSQWQLPFHGSPDASSLDTTSRTAAPTTGLEGCRGTVRDVQRECTNWIAWHEGPLGSGDDAFEDSDLSPEGDKLAMTGRLRTNDSLRAMDRHVAVVNTGTGQMLWTGQRDLMGDFDGGYDVEFTPDGERVIVVGVSWEPSLGTHLTIEAYDAEDGTQLFTAAHDTDRPFTNITKEWPQNIEAQVGPDGQQLHVYTQNLREGYAWNFATMTFDVTVDGAGELVWFQHFAPSGWDHFPKGIGLSPDGETVYTVGGSTQWHVGLYDDVAWVAVAYDADTGAERWRTTLNPSSQAGVEEPRDIAVSPDGENVYLAGNEQPPGQSPRAMIASLDADTGELDWTTAAEVEQAGMSFFTSLDPSPDGSRVYATGAFDTSRYWDVGTIAFDAETGNEQWTHLFDRFTDTPAASYPDFGGKVQASPDGARVAVAAWTVADGAPTLRLGGENPGAWTQGLDATLITLDPSTGAETGLVALGTGSTAFRPLGLSLDSGGQRAYLSGLDAHPDRSTSPAWMTAAYDLPLPTASILPSPTR